MNINSLNNEKVKNWAKLNNKKYRDEKGLFLVEGDHLVKESIKANCVKEIIVLAGISIETNLNTYEVSEAIMKKITNQVTIPNVCAVCYKLKESEINGNVLILDDIQDPGNLGTIIRSAVAFNVGTVIASPKTVDLYNDKVIRSSEGMLFNINYLKKDLNEAIGYLKKQNYVIYGTKVDGGSNLKNIPKCKKCAIIMGNEGSGVRKDILDKCDEYLYIPMNNKCESLNVGVATSIILYELF